MPNMIERNRVGHKVARPPALGEMVIEGSPSPVVAEPISIFRGPGHRVQRGATWNAPRPELADNYDDAAPARRVRVSPA